MRLILNGKPFEWHTIGQKDFSGRLFDQHELNDYEKNTLIFCHEWLSGKNEFELHTSGSTGIPKPVLIQRKQMQASALATIRALQLEKGDKALVCLNTAYIAGKMMLVRGFEWNMIMHVVTPVSNPLSDFSPNDRFDFMAVVPLQLQSMLAGNKEKLPILQNMKAIIVGGAPVDAALQKKLRIIRSPVYATYGMTETVSHIALKKLNGSDASDVFTVLEGVEVGTDVRGCLTIQGEVTGNEQIVTNDLVTFTGKNHFKWTGRIDHVINSGGIKISPEHLEQQVAHCFYELKINNRFFVAGLPDNRLGEKVILVIEGNPFEKAVENEISDHLLKKSQVYTVPKTFYYLPAFAVTATGKIARKTTLALLA